MGGAVGWEALALGMGNSTTDQSAKGVVVPQSLSRPGPQRSKAYHAHVRRDPFVRLPRGQIQEPSKSAPPNGSEFDSGVPKVLGIVLGQGGYGAVLQRVNGQRILVRPGSVLEDEHARVISISDDSVLLGYRFDEDGRARLLTRRISIHDEGRMVESPQGQKILAVER